jgi:hypothetical protein
VLRRRKERLAESNNKDDSQRNCESPNESSDGASHTSE